MKIIIICDSLEDAISILKDAKSEGELEELIKDSDEYDTIYTDFGEVELT